MRGEAVSFEQSWTFQGSYDDSMGINDMVDHNSAHTVEEFEDLSVIAFVQDREPLQIHQSIWSGQKISSLQQLTAEHRTRGVQHSQRYDGRP